MIVGESNARAADLLATRSDNEHSEREAAEEWLRDELADGEWHESRGIKARAKAAGYSERTLERARATLGAERDRRGFPSRAVWRLTVPPTPTGGTGGTGVGGTEETRTVERNRGDSGTQSRQPPEGGGTEPADELIQRTSEVYPDADRPRPCACESPLVLRDEDGQERCARYGHAPREERS